MFQKQVSIWSQRCFKPVLGSGKTTEMRCTHPTSDITSIFCWSEKKCIFDQLCACFTSIFVFYVYNGGFWVVFISWKPSGPRTSILQVTRPLELAWHPVLCLCSGGSKEGGRPRLFKFWKIVFGVWLFGIRVRIWTLFEHSEQSRLHKQNRRRRRRPLFDLWRRARSECLRSVQIRTQIPNSRIPNSFPNSQQLGVTTTTATTPRKKLT